MTRINISANDPSTIDWKTGAKAAEEKLSFIKTTLVKKLPGAGGNDVLGLVFELLNKRDALAAELDKVREAGVHKVSVSRNGQKASTQYECRFCFSGYWDTAEEVKHLDTQRRKCPLFLPLGERGKEIMAELDRYRKAYGDLARLAEAGKQEKT